MCQTKRCCCCIPIKCGTNIIGGLHAVYFLLFLYKGDFLGAAINFFSGSTFIAMMVKDTGFMRGLFCAAFTTYVCTVAILSFYFTFFMWEEDYKMFRLAVKERCMAFS